MLDRRIFNERPESQDRAIDQLRSMGYVYVSPAEAEAKRETKEKVPDAITFNRYSEGVRLWRKNIFS